MDLTIVDLEDKSTSIDRAANFVSSGIVTAVHLLKTELGSTPSEIMVSCVKITKAAGGALLRLTFVLPALPFLYFKHRYSAIPSTPEKSINQVEVPVEQKINPIQNESLALVPFVKIHLPPRMIHQARILEHMKLKAKAERDAGLDNYLRLCQYFRCFNKNVSKIFSHQAFIQNFNKDPDSILIRLSRESYLALTLVYRFNGPHMKKQPIDLMNVDDQNRDVVTPYQVDECFIDAGGLIGYGLIPLSGDGAPRLVFRGTHEGFVSDREGNLESLPTGLASDFAASIGLASYERTKEDIANWLIKASRNGINKVIVSGHSLGGAIAQRVACDNPLFVGSLFTLNSPRIEENIVLQQSVDSYNHMQITHVIMEKDHFISKAGGGGVFSQGTFLTSGNPDAEEVFLISGGGHTSKILNDYCMKGIDVHYKRTSIAKQLLRDRFWSSVINMIRFQT